MLILFPSHSKAGYCFCLAFLALLGVGVFQDIREGGGVFGNDQTELNVLQVGVSQWLSLLMMRLLFKLMCVCVHKIARNVPYWWYSSSVFVQLPSVFVNCIECFSSRYLYEHILNSLPLGQREEKLTAPITCDNMNDFVRHLKAEVELRKLQNETLYIVSQTLYNYKLKKSVLSIGPVPGKKDFLHCKSLN